MKSRAARRPGYDGHYKYGRDVSETYEQDRRVERHWQREDEFVAEFCRARRIGTVLDVPVGTGRFLTHYSEVGHVTGVDVSEDMLAEARKKLADLPDASRITLEAGDAFNLRFADRHFDLVIVWRLLHLIPEALLPDAIRELCRVTGRELLVQTYAALSDRARPPIPPPSFLKRGALRGRHYLRRIQDRLRSSWPGARASGAAAVAPPASSAKPWSHIEAFSHRQGLIDGMISSHGFQLTLARVLDEYDEHCDVRVAGYTRAVAAPGAQIPAEPR